MSIIFYQRGQAIKYAKTPGKPPAVEANTLPTPPVTDDGGVQKAPYNSPKIEERSSESIPREKPERVKVPKLPTNTGTPQDPNEVRKAIPPELAKHISDLEALSLTPVAARKMVQVYNKMPSTAHIAALAKIGKSAAKWYSNAGNFLKEAFGADASRFTALLASTSPNRSVNQNLHDASRIWLAYTEAKKAAGGTLSEKQVNALLENLNKTTTSGTMKYATNRGNRQAVGQALSASDPGSTTTKILARPQSFKIDSFRRNLLGELNDAVTNDTWVGKITGHNGGALSGKPYVYHANSIKFKQAAEKLTAETGEKWTPAEVQAASWSSFRLMALLSGASHWTPEAKAAFTTRHGVTIPDEPISTVQAIGHMTHNHLKAGANFVGLLANNPEVQKILSKAGVRLDKAIQKHQWVPTAEGNNKAVEGMNISEVNELLHAGRNAQKSSDWFRRRPNQTQKQGPKARFAASEARQPDGAVQPLAGTSPSPAAIPGPQEVNPMGASAIDVSPSVQEGMSFGQAYNRSQSGNQKAFKKIAEGVLENLGLKGKTHSAIGDWGGDVENSLYQEIPHPADPRKIEYAAAWYGLLANQKTVMVFHAQPNGPDSLYQIKVNETNLDKIRKELDRAGVEARTLIPNKNHTTVTIFDPRREMRNSVQKFASAVYAPITESSGSGKFIGDDSPGKSTRSKARSKYRAIIDAYESGKAGGDVQAEREALLGDYSRKGASAAFAKTGRKVKFSGIQSPTGGVLVRGLFYPGGKFIPKAELEKSTWKQYEQVQQRKTQLAMNGRRPDGSVEPKPVKFAHGPHWTRDKIIGATPKPKDYTEPAAEQPRGTFLGTQRKKGTMLYELSEPERPQQRQANEAEHVANNYEPLRKRMLDAFAAHEQEINDALQENHEEQIANLGKDVPVTGSGKTNFAGFSYKRPDGSYRPTI